MKTSFEAQIRNNILIAFQQWSLQSFVLPCCLAHEIANIQELIIRLWYCDYNIRDFNDYFEITVIISTIGLSITEKIVPVRLQWWGGGEMLSGLFPGCHTNGLRIWVRPRSCYKSNDHWPDMVQHRKYWTTKATILKEWLMELFYRVWLAFTFYGAVSPKVVANSCTLYT